jgi:Calcineurin-like phosphoesterase
MRSFRSSLLWKNLLLLFSLSSSLSRRDVVLAFVDTAFVSSQQPKTSSCRQHQQQHGKLLLLQVVAHSHLDIATAPLSHLIHLEQQQPQQQGEDKKQQHGQYQLVSPAADELPLLPNQRLICLGDVHGDFQALCDFLTLARVYQPSNQQWIGGNTILVQCGDVLDRGSQELQCFDLLTRLSQQAAHQGGHVILLWGNHEALNAGGMFHYTTGEDEYELDLGLRIDEQLQTSKWRMQYAGNQPARWAAYEPGSGVLAHPLLANMKVAVKVGKTVCVHAGLTKQHLEDYGGLHGMNEQARTWMQKCKSACSRGNPEKAMISG